MRGLSPRVRGNLFRDRHRRPICRSIPACAGEPSIRHADRFVFRVYPRVCGGTERPRQVGRLSRGLSPRVRGNLTRAYAAERKRRSIPACAGEPEQQRKRLPKCMVYPRVCGGTGRAHCVAVQRRGLSPRVRGNPRGRRRSTATPWSIPACAGEPHGCQYMRVQPLVYPRVCGGTRPGTTGRAELEGLSPRVRGNPLPLSDSRLIVGSIPACAGEPSSFCRSLCGVEVYPRVCGGTVVQRDLDGCAAGLSPRVRGNRCSPP